MKFEYDIHKSKTNKIKHGIDFKEAQTLWNDDNLFVLPLPFENEKRYACIGNIDGKILTAIITCRDGIIRIISVRRSRKDEVIHYES